MIRYRPTDGDPASAPILSRPRCAFIMTQLAEPLPTQLTEIRDAVQQILEQHGFSWVDAESVVTGKDFLLKIWELLHASALGIAVLHEGFEPRTLANIFLELGHMQAAGKEILIVKTPAAPIPSDLVRTEWIQWAPNFESRFSRFLAGIEERADYYLLLAEQLEKNPLLAIDYLRRAYLLTGDSDIRTRVQEIMESEGLNERAKNSVEALLATF